MADSPGYSVLRPGRRRVLAAAATLASAPWILKFAHAQQADLAPYLQAKVNWRQAEGETIRVAVTPAGYFENLIAVTPQFEALTGIKVVYDRVTSVQIREKAVADFSAKKTDYATLATDPMYYPLYVANNWVDRLDNYLDDSALTDANWFRYDDILRAWREAVNVGGTPYGLPYAGEVSLQIYRKDLYDEAGLKPAESIGDYLRNAQILQDASSGLYASAMRGFAGPGQNMYIYPSIFRSFGGRWIVDGRVRVNTPSAVGALEWYVHMQRKYAPAAVRDWSWPEIADAFAQGKLATYIDAHSSATVLNDPAKSRVIGRIGYARWPRGPTGKRITSVWTWSFPVNAALAPRAKRATWLFVVWAACEETQIRTSLKFPGIPRRTGVNRVSIWRRPEYRELMQAHGHNFLEAALESAEYDTDPDWRPRVPQWPAIGEAMGDAIHDVLVGKKKSKPALDDAQARIDRLTKG